MQDILDDGREVLRDRDDGVIFRETGALNSTLLHCCEYHRSRGKELLPMPLHELGRGGADAHNQIKRAIGKQSTEVLDKRSLRIFVAGTRSQKSDLSMISSGHGDCRSSSVRMALACSLQGLKSRPKE